MSKIFEHIGNNVGMPGGWGVIDTETHALENSRIVQIGGSFFRGFEHLETRCEMINPGCPITEGAMKIHGITDAMVADKPMFRDVAENWLTLLREKTPLFLATYNGRRYDVELLHRHFDEAGLSWVSWNPVLIDVFDFVKWNLRHIKGHKLEEMCNRYGIKLTAHDAGEDARATGELLILLVADGIVPGNLEAAIAEGQRIAPLLDEEWARYKYFVYQREDGRQRIGYGKHLGTPVDEVDRGFLKWALDKNQENKNPDWAMTYDVQRLFEQLSVARPVPAASKVVPAAEMVQQTMPISDMEKIDFAKIDELTRPYKREPLHIGPLPPAQRSEFVPASLSQMPKTAAAIYEFFGTRQSPCCLVELERDAEGRGKIVLLVPQGNTAATLQLIANELWSHIVQRAGLDARGEWSRDPSMIFVEVQQYASGQPDDFSIQACIANQPAPDAAEAASGGEVRQGTMQLLDGTTMEVTALHPGQSEDSSAVPYWMPVKFDHRRKMDGRAVMLPSFCESMLPPSLSKTAAWIVSMKDKHDFPFMLLAVERSSSGVGAVTLGIGPKMPDPNIKRIATIMREHWLANGHTEAQGEWSGYEGSVIWEVCCPDDTRRSGWRSSHEALLTVEMDSGQVGSVEVARAPHRWRIFELSEEAPQEGIAEHFPDTFGFLQAAMEHRALTEWRVVSLVRAADGMGRVVIEIETAGRPLPDGDLAQLANDLREQVHTMLIYREQMEEWSHRPDALIIGVKEAGSPQVYQGGEPLPDGEKIGAADFSAAVAEAQKMQRVMQPCFNCAHRVGSRGRAALFNLLPKEVAAQTHDHDETPLSDCKLHRGYGVDPEMTRESCVAFAPLSEEWFREMQPEMGWAQMRAASGKIAMFMPSDCSEEALSKSQIWAQQFEAIPGIECVEVHKLMPAIARTWNLGTVPNTGALIGGKLKRYFWNDGKDRNNIQCEIERAEDGTGALYVTLDYRAPAGLLSLIGDMLQELLNRAPDPREWNRILGRNPIGVIVEVAGRSSFAYVGEVGQLPTLTAGEDPALRNETDQEDSFGTFDAVNPTWSSGGGGQSGQGLLMPRRLRPNEMLQEAPLPKGMTRKPLTLLPTSETLSGCRLRLHTVRTALACLSSMIRCGESFTEESTELLEAAKGSIKEIDMVMRGGFSLIIDERLRQVTAEGWTPEHDAQHTGGELAWAAACYAAPQAILRKVGHVIGDAWPWHKRFDKRGKHDRLRRLVIAGALIAAEIDRMSIGGSLAKCADPGLLFRAEAKLPKQLYCSVCGRTTEALGLKGEKCAAPVQDDTQGYCAGVMRQNFQPGEVVKRLADDLLMTVEATASGMVEVSCVWAEFPIGTVKIEGVVPEAIDWATAEEIAQAREKWAHRVFLGKTKTLPQSLAYICADTEQRALELLQAWNRGVEYEVHVMTDEIIDAVSVSQDDNGAQMSVRLRDLLAERLGPSGKGEGVLWHS
jgi:DNA polymerase III epsilon subunit-like protein